MDTIDIKRVFVNEISGLVDEYSGEDFELMTKLEDFARDILILVDSCRPDLPSFYLCTDDSGGGVLSGNLHHDIMRCRLRKNPAREPEMRKCIKEYLQDIVRNRDHHSSCLPLCHHSANSSSIASRK
jgi:hypothetical protein